MPRFRLPRWPWLLLILVLGLLLMRLPGWWLGPEFPTYAVQSGPLLANVVATGRVRTPSRVTLGSEIAGVLIERHVAEGDRVEPGQVVARLRADELQARLNETEAALAQLEQRQRPESRAALREARARADQARREAERAATLLASGLIARERAEQAQETLAIAAAQADRAATVASALAEGGVEERLLRERIASARAQLQRSEIRSSVAGTVLRRLAEPGDVLGAGRGIVEVAVDGPTEIVAQVDERNLDRLALGQPALVSADAFPERREPGEVSFIAPSVEAQTGTVEVRVRLPQPPAYLRQDMTVSIDIEVGRREQALSLPLDALRNPRPGAAEVWVLREGRVERLSVRTGLRGLERVELLEGLAAGERVLPARLNPPLGSRARAVDAG
ncbi:MAG: efflux RND transporter periplasmic adaptor subunit [Aquimonas sp.]|nr:efflux RND transporter periplasmic adaptor subunit [Aquimonas sp.]